MSKIDIDKICEIALKAGEKILEVYHSSDFDIQSKEDKSPVTKADIIANDYICDELTKLYADIPILSEERKALPFNERKSWSSCFIVDPIDGTKEFIKKNGEFTVNIAYVEEGIVKEGVVYAPAIDLMYFTKGGEAFKVEDSKTVKLPCFNDDIFRVVISRSHPNEKTQNYIEKLKVSYPSLEVVTKGSSLKFCMVAEGTADIYPRLGPTMEWDSAAAHAVVKAAGGNVTVLETGKELTYNREKLLNPYFLAKNINLTS